jgi:hypothetical protein
MKLRKDGQVDKRTLRHEPRYGGFTEQVDADFDPELDIEEIILYLVETFGHSPSYWRGLLTASVG